MSTFFTLFFFVNFMSTFLSAQKSASPFLSAVIFFEFFFEYFFEYLGETQTFMGHLPDWSSPDDPAKPTNTRIQEYNVPKGPNMCYIF